MNYIYLSLAVLGVIVLIYFVFIRPAIRAKAKRNATDATRKVSVENFLEALSDKFYDAKWTYESHPPGRPNDQIAADIAKDIAEALGSKLEALFSNVSRFPRDSKKIFSADNVTNTFVALMFQNLASLCDQYNCKGKNPRINCKDALFRIAKLKAVEALESQTKKP